MSLQARLDAFKADFEAGEPPYNVPRSVIETMHHATGYCDIGQNASLSYRRRTLPDATSDV